MTKDEMKAGTPPFKSKSWQLSSEARRVKQALKRDNATKRRALKRKAKAVAHRALLKSQEA